MDTYKSSLELVLDNLDNKNFQGALNNCQNAQREFDSVNSHIRKNYGTRYDDALRDLKELLQSVKTNQSEGANSHLKRARSAFDKYVKLYIQKEDGQKQDAKRADQPQYTDSYNTQHGGAKDIKQNRADPVRHPEYDNINNAKKTYVISQHANSHLASVDKRADSSWGPNKIADNFYAIYDHDWAEAHAELQTQQPDEKKIVGFLLKIVEEAYQTNKTAAEQQIKDMEKCALEIVMGRKTQTQSSSQPPSVKGDKSLLLQYRKDNAAIAVDKLRQEFEKNKLQQIYREFKISHMQVVNEFAASCVEITWWMCVQDPPIHMVCNDKTPKFDKTMYDAILQSGNRVDYIVWPPLLPKNGIVLKKGVVVCKRD